MQINTDCLFEWPCYCAFCSAARLLRVGCCCCCCCGRGCCDCCGGRDRWIEIAPENQDRNSQSSDPNDLWKTNEQRCVDKSMFVILSHSFESFGTLQWVITSWSLWPVSPSPPQPSFHRKYDLAPLGESGSNKRNANLIKPIIGGITNETKQDQNQSLLVTQRPAGSRQANWIESERCGKVVAICKSKPETKHSRLCTN